MRYRSSTQAVLETPFRLDSIDEVASPSGDEGTWYRYVIAQGSNTITGVRSGTRAEVGSLVETMVERLNERLSKQQARMR